MRLYIRGPGIGPVRTTLYSSGGRKSGSKSYAGRLILGVILTGATFGVSPVLGVLLVVAEFATVVTLLVRYLRPSRPARPAHPKAVKTGKLVPTAEWRAGHVPASAEYKAAHPAGPRDWESRS